MVITVKEEKDPDSGLVISRTAEITPEGHARGMVTVSMRERYVPESLAIIPVVNIAWDSGRLEWQLDGLELVNSFIRGLQKAIDIAVEWEAEFRGRKR